MTTYNSKSVPHSRRRGLARWRRGTSTVELALAMPLVLSAVFGLIEFGQYLYVKHCFESAARDAMRVAVLDTATQTSVTNVLKNTLTQANITYNSAWLTITDLGPGTPGTVANIASVPMGDQMQLTLSTTYGSIPNTVRPLYSMTGVGIGNSKTVVGECTMVKE